MKRHYTVGIAGHVDHGKTTLVQALSGVDTDRLKEEKRRGLSIEFGIAPLFLPSGRQVSLVDVPGHKDFMKNTIRGLGAVDAAILVVAADDGIMPQTREHFDILRYFGVSSGIVVLTKADLVDDETLEMASLEIQDLVTGSFLENGPIIPFSSVFRQGHDEIRSALDVLLFSLSENKEFEKPFRMFIDQIRTFHGLGTVVSGTILSGILRTGDQLQILPIGQTVRVRSLEVHHCSVDEAFPGCRVGINLQRIGDKELARGMVLTAPGAFRAVEFLNADLRLSSVPGHFVTGQRVYIHIGSAVEKAYPVIMGGEKLVAGDQGLVQFRLAAPMGATPLDRYVITSMNSHSVLGGGKILETSQIKFRQARADRIIPYLMELRTGDHRSILKAAAAARPEEIIRADEMARATGLKASVFEAALRELVSEGYFVPVGDRSFMAAQSVADAKSAIVAAVKKALTEDTLRDQIGKSAIAAAVHMSADAPVLEFLLPELVQEGVLAFLDGGYALKNANGAPEAFRDPLLKMVISVVEESGTVSMTVLQVCEALGQTTEKPKIKKLIGHLVSKKHVVRLDNERFISQHGLTLAKQRVHDWIFEHGQFRISDCQPALGCGRTLGTPLLEYLDRLGFTERHGNERLLKSGAHVD